MNSGKETRTEQIVVPRLFFAMMFACVLYLAGQTACFASTVVLQWDPNTDADLAGYKVYYQAGSSTQPFKGTGATQGTAPLDVPKNLNQTTETISGLDPAHPYYFAVTAYNTSGVESAYSNVVYVPELVSPTVSLSYPANNATVSGTVSVTASASDNVGVTKVEFYVNGALQTMDTSTPYLYSWNTSSLAAGSYTLMAKAYDAAGNVGQSTNVSVTVVKDSTAPTVSVTAPANNATVSGTKTITATASDNVGVSKVEFYENGILLSATNVSPYSYSWNTATVTNGTYALTARAYDAANNVGQSSIVKVTVSNSTSDTTAPTVSMTAPVNNSTVSGTVSVTASASDNVGVSKVEFYVNGTLQATDTASPYTFSWNSASLTNGAYILSAKAYDAAGNVSQSSNVSVTVNNSPSVSVTPLPPIIINNGSPYTKKTAVSLALTYLGAASMQFSTNGTTWIAWGTYAATKNLTLPSGGGLKTVSVRFRDSKMVISDIYSATIMLDTKAPVNGTLTPTQLAGNRIQLDWAGFSDPTSGISSYKLVRGATTLPAASCTGAAIATPAANETTYTDTGSQGMKYFYRLCAVDNAGNVSTGATTHAVMAIPEVTKPSGTVSINQGNYTNKAAVTLNLTAKDDTNVAAYCISNTTKTCTTWTKLTTPVTSLTIPAKPWTLAAGADGNRTVNVWFKDVWGNVSDPTSASITLDKTPPVKGNLAIDPATFILSWKGFSDATSGIASYVLVRGTTTTYPACSTISSAFIYSGDQTSFDDSSNTNSGTTYYYRLCAVDNAGKISTGATARMKKP